MHGVPGWGYEPQFVEGVPCGPGVRCARVPVDGLNFYAVGDDGSLWSRWCGAWEPVTPFLTTKGHLGVNLVFAHGARRRFYLQVLVCLAFYGHPPDDSYEACHNDGNHLDCRLSNLRWDTQGNNNKDRSLHRSIRGE